MIVTLMTSDKSIDDMMSNAAYGGLNCKGLGHLIDAEEFDRDSYLERIKNAGHESVLEHIVLSFHVFGASRALLQQLARHRHISLSVESTRTCLPAQLNRDNKIISRAFENAISYNITNAFAMIGLDPNIELDEDMQQQFYDICEYCAKYINTLRAFCKDMQGKLSNKYLGDMIKYFIPECYPTQFVMTLNLRELRHILKLRTSSAALFEFQQLAVALYRALPESLNYLLDDCLDDEVEERVDSVLDVFELIDLNDEEEDDDEEDEEEEEDGEEL